MGNTLITMIVDMQRTGQEYADKCLEVLQTKYGVNIETIDQQEFSYGPVGYILDCQALGHEPKLPEQYLDEMLGHYSDYGLQCCGLTRQQYERRRYNKPFQMSLPSVSNFQQPTSGQVQS